jgi:hypothetical protein
MTRRSLPRLALWSLSLAFSSAVCGQETSPGKPWPEAIMDNSFLIEEAYNQDPGVVQFIFNFLKLQPQGDWQSTFTNEWPVPGEQHQLSYTLLYDLSSTLRPVGSGDTLVNYRYQALDEERDGVAFAPRFTLVLPTGNRNKDLSTGVTGYQVGLPFSKRVSAGLAVHLNLGATCWPGESSELDSGQTVRFDQWSVSQGASAIWLASPTFNVMLEALASQVETPGADGRLSWQHQALLSPGFRYAFNLKAGQLVVGAAVPVGLTKASPDPSLFLYLSWEMPIWHPRSGSATE